MNARNVLLTLHILFAIVTIGWLATQALLMPGAIRRGEAAFVRVGAKAAERFGPAASIVFLLGLALVLRDKHDLADFKDQWVSMSMLLFVVAIVNGAVFIGGAERRAAAKLATGTPAPEEATRVRLLGLLNITILTVIVWLMVAKPGA
ncbi:MAG: putative integral rane protein [Frankiaceae bacterium]|jgi:uncharacterized membrane protein|nr:putative integral rane protein [Frankiaceae bacterium]